MFIDGHVNMYGSEKQTKRAVNIEWVDEQRKQQGRTGEAELLIDTARFGWRLMVVDY